MDEEVDKALELVANYLNKKYPNANLQFLGDKFELNDGEFECLEELKEILKFSAIRGTSA